MKRFKTMSICVATAGALTVAALMPIAAFGQSDGRVFRDCDICPEMVVVPGGTFLMGSSEAERSWAIQAGSRADWLENEQPRRKVAIPRKLAVGKYEVTQAEWLAVMGTNPSFFKGATKPVEFVSWNDVQEFLNRLSRKASKRYRLLTEAEWEYAARASTTTPFSTGNAITPLQANFDGSYIYGGSVPGSARNETIPVGSFAPNAFGLHDMHGNVWEWTADCYREKAYRLHSTAAGNRDNSRRRCHRVLRGGAYYNAPMNLRSAKRYWFYPIYRADNIGFRVARDMPKTRLATPKPNRRP